MSHSNGPSIGGVILNRVNFVLLLVCISVLTATCSARHRQRDMVACQNNLKQLGLVFKLFATEDKTGGWPLLSTEPGRLMFSNDAHDPSNPIVPNYLTDLAVMVCPGDTDRALLRSPAAQSDPGSIVDDYSYFYVGYMVTSDSDVQTFAEMYRKRIAQGLPFNVDVDVSPKTGTAGRDKLYRLREGAERWVITDANDLGSSARAQASLPVLIERPGNHVPEGGNVLYMDGHVEWKSYPGDWPMTETTIRTLESLDAM